MSNRTALPKSARKTPVRQFPAWARKEIEDAIERLLALLDAADPDPDIEDDDPAGGDVVDEPHDQVEEGNDEPSLGATHTFNQQYAWTAARTWLGADLEFDGETAPSADNQPSLGSLGVSDQSNWAQGAADDREK